MEGWHLWDDNKFSYSDYIFTFDNGSYIELFGLEDEGKARGPGRDILFVNEANLIEKKLYNQLAMRTTGQIFLDWNPADFVSWVYEVADNPLNKKIHSTFKNNLSQLSDNQVALIESYKDLPDDYLWKVFGEGVRGAAKEIIYTQWKYGELPGKGDAFYGLDFGFNHPAALVKVEHYEGTNYVQECIYQSNLTLADLIQKIKEYVKDRSPIYADAAEPKSIEEIYRAGINIKAASKDVWAGILKVKSYPLVIDSRSKNIQKELSSYKWKKDKNDNIIEEPVKANDDACFVFNTQITTISGPKNIGEIVAGDMVLTSKGFNKILIKHDNGVRNVCKYILHFDTHSVTLNCTENHLINTVTGWKEISKLQSGELVSLLNTLMEEHLHYMPEEGILHAGQHACIGMYGKQHTEEKEERDFIYTILTEMHGTMIHPTLKKCGAKGIYQNIQAIERRTKLRNGNARGLRLLLHDIQAKKGVNGIRTMQKNTTLVNHWTYLKSANIAGKTLSLKQSTQNSAIQTAKLKHLECVTSWQERVYDLTVENNHEYFANGVLVHNCDAMRYAIYSHFDKPTFKIAVG